MIKFSGTEIWGSGSDPVNDLSCVSFTGSRLSPPSPLSSKKEHRNREVFLSVSPHITVCLLAVGFGCRWHQWTFNVIKVILIRFRPVTTKSFSPPPSFLHLLCLSFELPSGQH